MKQNDSNPLSPASAVINNKTDEGANVFSLNLSFENGMNFSAKPGQFNMIGIPGIGEAPFSFSSLASDGSFTHTIRMAGNVVGAIAGLNLGDKLFVRGPYGTGWPLDFALGKNVIIIAGGIGLPPLRPAIYHLLENKKNFKKITLLYGAKTVEELLYKNELEKWSQDFPVLLSADRLTQKTSMQIKEGVVTILFHQLDIPMDDTVAFLCGPQIMMKFAAAELILRGLKMDRIFVSMERRMKCGITHCGHCQIGAKYVCKDGPVFSLSDINRFADSV